MRVSMIQSLYFTLCFLTATRADTDFDDIHGAVSSVSTTLSWARRNGSNHMRDETYIGGRQHERCDFPIDLVLIEDTGASATRYLQLLKSAQFTLMAQALSISHPGSRFGMVAYRDKPVWGFGALDDYCQKVLLPLTPWPLDIATSLQTLSVGSTESAARNQLGALIAASQSTRVGWEAQSTATRVAVLSTRSFPHFAEDGKNTYGMLPYSGQFDEALEDEQCTREYYPSVAQVKSALTRQEIYLGTLTHPVKKASEGDHVNDSVSGDSFTHAKTWRWLNAYLGQTPEFVQTIDDELWKPLAKIIQTIEDIECAQQDIAPDSPSTPAAESPQPTLSGATPIPTVVTPRPTIDAPTITASNGAPTVTGGDASEGNGSGAGMDVNAGAEEDDLDVIDEGDESNEVEDAAAGDGKQVMSTQALSSGPARSVLVTPVGTIESTSSEKSAETQADCTGDDEVVIRLKHRPMRLNLEVENDISNDQ